MTTKKSEQNETPKVGVYICHCGGNISDHVDVKQVAEKIKEVNGVTVSHTNMFMCSDPGQELIQKDIKNGEINRVVVASCAPSLHETTFRGAIKRAGMNPYQYEHANIREQNSWVHHGNAATEKAIKLISAAIAKSRYLKPLEPIRVDAIQHVTVIGGGIAGLRTALDLSKRGIAVALVEKTPFLGGQAANLDRIVPTEEKAGDLIKQLAGDVMADDRIRVYTCSQVAKSEGYVGNFRLTIQTSPPSAPEDREKLKQAAEKGIRKGDFAPFAGFLPEKAPTTEKKNIIETGAVIFASGFIPYKPKTGEFGYGENPEVITLPQLIRILAEKGSDKTTLKINGREIRRVAMLHCVGSRQIPGIHEPDDSGTLNEYCSRTCCSATLQAAIQIREKFPGTHVFEYFRDIRTYGRGHEEFYERASKNNVMFFRFEPEDPPVVERSTGGQYPLKVTVKDTLTFGEELSAEVDMVVLAVGMIPGPIADLVEMMKLPLGADRFLQEVHPKLRPVELANTGMLLAGTCQAPMNISETCNAAQAAASKATSLLSKGYVELDPFVAGVDMEKCRGNGSCAKACPVDAIRLKSMEIDGQTVNRADINPALCTGCGVCVAVCPENAIDVKGWTLKQYEAMVDAIVAN